jgi:FMN phosphatase YigB (HAD superfamily)
VRQGILPLWRHVIFVDWHGVLSRDPFWTSILGSARHPLRSRLEAKLGEIFAHGAPTGHEWMKGIRSSDEIVAAMAVELPGRFKSDYLQRRLERDCRRMTINVELLSALRTVRQKMPVAIVIATDNMDCFARAFDYLRRHTRRPYAASSRLADWAVFCDDIICSSDLGKLKSEDPVGFFGPWLVEYELSFSDSLLIDDRTDNCHAFTRAGGAAVQWKMGAGDTDEVTRSIDNWLLMSMPH